MDSTSYTPSANQVLLLAQEQANYFKHQAIGTEHLLLALVGKWCCRSSFKAKSCK